MFSRSKRHSSRVATHVRIGSVLDSAGGQYNYNYNNKEKEALAINRTNARRTPDTRTRRTTGIKTSTPRSLLIDQYDDSDNQSEEEKQEKQLVSHDYHDHSNIPVPQHPKPKKCGRGGVAKPFPLKLYHMLQQVDKEGIADIISWQPHGRCFHVHKPKAFLSQVLQRFFLQKKMASFQRQLNLYKFNRITAGPDKGSYYHEFFLRGKEFLVQNIYRMKVKGTGSRLASNPDAEPNFYDMPFLDENDDAIITATATATTTTTTTAAANQPEEEEEGSKQPCVSRRPKRRGSFSISRRTKRRSIETFMKETTTEMPPLPPLTVECRDHHSSPSSSSCYIEGTTPLPFNTAASSSSSNSVTASAIQERRRSSLLSLSNFLDGVMNNNSRSSSYSSHPSSSNHMYGGAERNVHHHHHHQELNNAIVTTTPSYLQYDYPAAASSSSSSSSPSSSPQDIYHNENTFSPELIDLMMLSNNRQDLPLGGGGGSFHHLC